MSLSLLPERGPDQVTLLQRAIRTINNMLSGDVDGLYISDGVPAPSTVPTKAVIYIDVTDGSLKVRFGSGTIKTITTDP
jgi:hypothetical protein